MDAEAVDIYLAGFVARRDAVRDPGAMVIDEPGMHGVLPRTEGSRARLLVSDDRARDALAALLPDVRVGMISVLAAAARCAELLRGDPAWTPDGATAMVCRDLRLVPAVRLPSELTVRPVARLADDAPGGVALADAVTVVKLSAPEIAAPPDVLADFLRSLPRPFRLFAAIDDQGTARATSGSAVFGSYATVIFVNTRPGWRRRGIGQAMTAVALRAARMSGARRACLDASDAGVSIYRRLGFEAVSAVTRFSRVG